MRKRSLSILALVIALIITTYFILIIWGSTGVSGGRVTTDIFDTVKDTAFGSLFTHPDIDDRLPHYVYQHLADSFKQIQDERELENRSTRLSGTSFGSLGVYAMEAPGAWFKQVLSQPVNINKAEPGELYYLGITDYSLAYEKKFFVQNGTYNLAIPKLDSLKKAANGDSFRYIHYERKQIPVRYSTENKRVLIPVSPQQWKVLKLIIPVFSFSLIFAALYFFLGLPIQILINISKGKAFDDRNIKRFSLMARVLLCWGVIHMFSSYILHFFFRKMIPDDFQLPGFWDAFWGSCGIFLLVLAIFITGKAFQKGNKLQKEQDLTI